MNKKSKPIKRQQPARKKQFLKWRAENGTEMTVPDSTKLLAALEQREAQDAGMPIEQYRGLSEHERTRHFEDAEDKKSASGYGMTLAEFRRERRRRIERGQMREEYSGFPSWLRDEYARERPIETAVEYLSLLTALETTTGPALKETLNKIAARTWRGWIIDRTVEEGRTLLLEEIDRAGLGEIFREARDQAELQRILNS